jgi:hypothetical protein
MARLNCWNSNVPQPPNHVPSRPAELSQECATEQSQRSIFLEVGGNFSLDLFEPDLSHIDRLKKLAALGDRSFSRGMVATLTKAFDLKKEKAKYRDMDYANHCHKTFEHDEFIINDYAVRKAELWIDHCPYRPFPGRTATTPSEYMWAIAEDSLCADFAAMYIQKEDDGNDYYVVKVHNGSKDPTVSGLYLHDFYSKNSKYKKDEVDIVYFDINRRSCLLRASMFHFHPVVKYTEDVHIGTGGLPVIPQNKHSPGIKTQKLLINRW